MLLINVFKKILISQGCRRRLVRTSDEPLENRWPMVSFLTHLWSVVQMSQKKIADNCRLIDLL